MNALLHNGQLPIGVLLLVHTVEALIVLGGKQLLKLGRRLLQGFKSLGRLGLLGEGQLVRDYIFLMLRMDLLEGLVDFILGNLLHNVRAKVVVGNPAFTWRFTPALLEVLDVLVDARLLSHDALNVNLVGVVLILDQSCLDGLLQSTWVHGHFPVRDLDVNSPLLFVDTGREFNRFGWRLGLRRHLF